MSDVEQLPRGRHGLSREEVRASQRTRMLEAMTLALAEVGYAKVTVAQVIRRARVSRETFYEHFRDKDDCFAATLEAATAIMAERFGEAFAALDGEPLERLDAVLALYLDSLATSPALARTFLVEVYGAGPDAVRRRAAVLDRFADLFAELLDARDGERRFACEAYVAAISSMVTMRVATGETDDLPALREPLVRLAGRLFGEDAR